MSTPNGNGMISPSRVGMKDVAEKACVSIATVSRVINNNGSVRSELRLKVEAAMRELNYSHNTLARSLKTNESQLIALIVDSITNPIYPQFALGVEATAEKHGFSAILCNIEGNAEKELQYVRRLSGLRVDGFIFAVSKVPQGTYGTTLSLHAPVVCLDKQIFVPESDRVVLDHAHGAFQMTRFLIESGHRRIAHIAGPGDYLTAKERTEGYSAALEETNISTAPHLVVEGDYTAQGGETAMRKLLELDERPTAVFAANDLMAIGAMKAIKSAGLKVPDDVAVAGFDDIPFAELHAPALTTVVQPTVRMGALAVRMLMERLQGKVSHDTREMILQPTLAIRESA
jgi:LacI family transcriptional regulator